MGIEITEVIIRILVTSILSGAIGYEREMQSRPAGLRTHIIVGIGATLFMIIALEMHEVIPDNDVSRIPAQVVSGIGFLGAGTIFAQRGSISGLTTAASLWLVAGIGLITGLGRYLTAIFSTGMGLLILVSLKRLQGFIQLRQNQYLSITMNESQSSIGTMIRVLKSQGLVVEDIHIENPHHLDDQTEGTDLLVKVQGFDEVNIEILEESLSRHNLTLNMNIRGK